MDSPLLIIINIVFLLLQSGISTLQSLWRLFSELLMSLGFIAGIGGGIGIAVAVVVFCSVGFLLAKFFISSGRQLVILIAIAAILLFLLGIALT